MRMEAKMEVSYNKLWKLMIDKGMPNKSDLRELTGIGTNTLAKLSKNQQVSMEVLMKICSNTKNYFDTRDSGAYERGVAWKYALQNGMKYFCFGVNNQVDKFSDYVFSLECDEAFVEQISGTKDRFFDGCTDTGKYSSVCDEFDRIGLGIFGSTFRELYYDKQRDEA